VKILLDECLPVDFRHSFHGQDAHTARWAGFAGLGNDELLRAAEAAGYDLFVTIDQGMAHQQNWSERKLSVLLLRTRTNQLEDLLPLLDSIQRTLKTIRTGQVVVIGPK
jgi:predicted nuclease of predicted toxin-antitoxin system